MHRFALAAALATAAVAVSTIARAESPASFFLDPNEENARAARHAALVPANMPGAEDQSPDPSGYTYADPYAGGVSPIPREIVDYDTPRPIGSIVVSTTEKRLYLVLPNHQALRYGVGVGRPGFEWSGIKTISAKKEWPDWTPPPEMIKRRPDLPRHMAGGIDNPLGARAMYLGGSEYRIHGSNEPDTIGQAVSSGCIRMTNDDVADLYDRVKVGTQAYIEP